MVEGEEPYEDVLVQLLALRSAVNRILALYLAEGLETLLLGSSSARENEDDNEALKEGLERLKRSLALVLKRS